MPSIITLGSRVSAKVGPLLEAPARDPSVAPPGKRSRRRTRATYHGTVIESIGGTVWRVYWDDCNKTSDHLSTSLRVHGKEGESTRSKLSIEEVSALNKRLSGQPNVHIGSHVKMLEYTMRLSAAIVAPPAADIAAPAADIAAADIAAPVADPHISHIIRKPEPLGTEFKNALDTKSEICLKVRLCRKKTDDAGDNSYDHVTHLKTARATLDLMNGTKRDESIDYGEVITNKNATPDTYIGDAWFASVDLAYHAKHELGVNFIGVVKNNSKRYCKTFLTQTMEKWPGGSHLLLQTDIDGVRLYALGYKYCKKKVMCFIFNEGAGHTEPGQPYIAKWTDKNGNRCERRIPRPQVCSTYFQNSNGIDVHNQMRQKELKLEKCWVTADGYFRIITSLFGITVVDAWRGYRRSTRPSHRHHNLPLLKFVDMLVLDMLNNDLKGDSDATTEDSISAIRNKNPPMMDLLQQNESQQSEVSELTWCSPSLGSRPSLQSETTLEHRRIVHLSTHIMCTETDVVNEGGKARTARKRCHLCYGKTNKSKTKYYCSAPSCEAKARGRHYWICKQCWGTHVNEVSAEYDGSID